MHLYPVDGAVNRVGKNDTAFSHRDSKWSMVIGGIDPYPVNYERLVAVKAKWDPANLFRVNQNIKAMSS
jgi:hypothetical protein